MTPQPAGPSWTRGGGRSCPHRGHEVPRPWRLTGNPRRWNPATHRCGARPRHRLEAASGLTVRSAVVPEGETAAAGDRPRASPESPRRKSRAGRTEPDPDATCPLSLSGVRVDSRPFAPLLSYWCSIGRHDEGVGGSGGRREAERSLGAFRDRTRPASAAPASLDRPPTRRQAARHCWVMDPPMAPGRWPGIVVEWRQREGRWEGRVVVVLLNGSDSQLVCAWFDQDHLAPAD